MLCLSWARLGFDITSDLTISVRIVGARALMHVLTK